MLAYAVMQAVNNANGQPVTFSGVADPSNLTDWADILALLVGINDAYNLVPLTRLPSVLSAYQAHILAVSVNSIGGQWRRGWFNLCANTTLAIDSQANSSDSNVVMATLGDNPDQSGTQYTLFTVTSGNSQFVTNGVMPGDIVRYLFGVDAFGNSTYSTFTVASVVNQASLVVVTGNSVAVTQTQKIEVWRNLSRDQSAAQLVTQQAAAINERFIYLWPDQITDDNGLVVPGYHLCAAYAAFVGGIAPQQGVRQVSISGFSAAPRSTVFFNNGQLNTLAAAGFFVVTQDPTTGDLYASFARNSDMSSISTQEEVVVRLTDATMYLLWNTAMANRGNTNLTGQALAQIRTELQSAIQQGISNTNIGRIGPMIQAATITQLTVSLTEADRLVLVVSVSLPFPLNDTTLTLTF
jgi:hypothetical protein